MKELFEVTKHVYDEYKSTASQISATYHEKEKTYNGNPDDLYEEEDEKIRDLLTAVHKKFNAEYRLYKIKKIYFYGCAFNIYRDLYEERLEHFLQNTHGASEIDFIEFELKEEEKSFNKFWLDENMKMQISIAINRRTEFLLDKALEYDYKYIDKKLVYFPESSNENELNLLEDYEIGSFSINQKVIVLHKSGVLDCLRKQEPFNTNTNAMARLLAKITGDNISSINKAISPVLNQSISSRNNPYNKEENENRVNSFFSNIGYDPNNLD
jgi:hypothetical protein